MSTDDHPKMQAFRGAMIALGKVAAERFPRLTPPAPRPPPDDEDLEVSPAHVPGDLGDDLPTDGAISSRRP